MEFEVELEHVNIKMAIYMMELGIATNDLDKVSKSTKTAPNTMVNG